MTTRRAAPLIGTDHSMLVRYEAADVRLPARLVGPIAAAYGVPVEEVLVAVSRDQRAREARAAREEAGKAAVQ